MDFQDIPELSRLPGKNHQQEFNGDRLGFLRRASQGGPLCRFTVFGNPLLLVNTPEIIHEVLVEKARHFEKSPVLRMALYPLAGEGLFTSRGELWKRQRHVMSPLFFAPQIGRYARDMAECGERGVSRWRDGDVVDLGREMTRITMSIIGKSLFDADTFDEADELGAALTTALEWTSASVGTRRLVGQAVLINRLEFLARKLPEPVGRAITQVTERFQMPILWPGERQTRLRQAIRTLDERIQGLITERRAHPTDRPDLLTRLLEVRDEAGQSMTDRQVRDEAVTLFVAGHETTATALTWAFHLLAQNPAVREQLEAEVGRLGDRALSADDAAQLPVAGRIFKEALRLYPPVPIFARQAQADTELAGYRVPRATIVFVAPFTLHRRPELWPEPDRFHPDRFADPEQNRRSRHTFLSFSSGPRVCLGQYFANLEGQLLLAAITRKARLEPEYQGAVEPDVATATLRPSRPLPMRVRLRS